MPVKAQPGFPDNPEQSLVLTLPDCFLFCMLSTDKDTLKRQAGCFLGELASIMCLERYHAVLNIIFVDKI